MTVDLIVYLAAAVIAVPLAKRLGLGSVIGYLVAGFVIGPWGLRLVTDVEIIGQVSEFGVVLMLFLIGLELDLERLWALRGAVFGCGGAQIGVTGVAADARADGLRRLRRGRRAAIAGLGARDVVDRDRHAGHGRTQHDGDAGRSHRLRDPRCSRTSPRSR